MVCVYIYIHTYAYTRLEKLKRHNFKKERTKSGEMERRRQQRLTEKYTKPLLHYFYDSKFFRNFCFITLTDENLSNFYKMSSWIDVYYIMLAFLLPRSIYASFTFFLFPNFNFCLLFLPGVLWALFFPKVYIYVSLFFLYSLSLAFFIFWPVGRGKGGKLFIVFLQLKEFISLSLSLTFQFRFSTS